MNTLSSILYFIGQGISAIVTNQTAKKVLAAPNNATGKPSFRELQASDITSGAFTTDRIPNLDASKINSGTLNAARIPSLDASKITSGVFNTGRIPNIDASKINSGTLDAARIPNLSASKITSGSIDMARLPIVCGSTVYNDENVPPVPVTQITVYIPALIGKSFVIAGAQDAGNPVLRTSLVSATGKLTVYLADPVTVMRINYIAW